MRKTSTRRYIRTSSRKKRRPLAEKWKIISYPGFHIYEVSNRGKVRHLGRVLRNKIGSRLKLTGLIKPRVRKYAEIRLREHVTRRERTFLLKNIVADHFMKLRTKAVVIHRDKDITNCDIRNLKEKGKHYSEKGRPRYISPELLKQIEEYLETDTAHGRQKRVCDKFDLDKSTVSLICKKKRHYEVTKRESRQRVYQRAH